VARRATILFAIDENAREFVILGVLYGGQDVEALAVKRSE
jgi:microcystin-dependent protein